MTAKKYVWVAVGLCITGAFGAGLVSPPPTKIGPPIVTAHPEPQEAEELPRSEPLGIERERQMPPQSVDERVEQTGILTKLLETCGPIPASHGMCSSDIYKPVWRSFENLVGEIIKVDTKSVNPMAGGGAIAWTYQFVPGTAFDTSRLHQYYFTCHGQYRDMEFRSPMDDAPPRAVIGVISDYVCSAAEAPRRAIMAQNAKVEAEAHDRAVHPRASDYCVDFSAEACARIKIGVEAKITPDFCRPGFGIVGSGLDDEQLRICYARPLSN